MYKYKFGKISLIVLSLWLLVIILLLLRPDESTYNKDILDYPWVLVYGGAYFLYLLSVLLTLLFVYQLVSKVVTQKLIRILTVVLAYLIIGLVIQIIYERVLCSRQFYGMLLFGAKEFIHPICDLNIIPAIVYELGSTSKILNLALWPFYSYEKFIPIMLDIFVN